MEWHVLLRLPLICLPLLVNCERPPAPVYVNPTAAAEELGHLILDERAEVVDVDGGRPVHRRQIYDQGEARTIEEPLRDIYLTPGCHVVKVSYKATYYPRRLESRRFADGRTNYDPNEFALDGHVNEYESAPMRFFVQIDAGYAYWVTASFDGDNFKPRIARVDPSGEASLTILAEQPCTRAPVK